VESAGLVSDSTSTEKSGEDAAEQTCVRLIGELLASWNSTPARTLVDAGVVPARWVSIYGLVAHAHRVAAAAMILNNQGLVLEAMPLVRQVYECSITANWLLRVEDATLDFLSESHRQRTLLVDDMKVAFPTLDQEAATRLADEFTHEPGTAEQAARKFIERCNDLQPGGVQAYVNYRFLSGFSHPSHFLIDQYLDMAEGATEPTLRKAARAWHPATALDLLATPRVAERQAAAAQQRDPQ
jgi:hypothetical protein